MGRLDHKIRWILHRRLGAESDEHLTVLATAPPDLRTSLQVARHAAERSARFVHRATADLKRAEAHLGDFEPMSGLRRSGRTRRSGAEHALARAAERLESVRVERRASEHHLAELEVGEARRLRFVADNGWRAERVRAIDAELDRHWATATLAAVRQDDPLAFGIDRLRSARAMAAADLAAYRAGLPPDRSAAVTEATRTLAAAEQDLRHRRAELVQHGQRLELLYSAADPTTYAELAVALRAMPRVPVTEAVVDRAIEVQGQLAVTSEHRSVPLPDLLIAACAESSGLTVPHYDADYDRIAGVTGQSVQWIVPRGSVS